MAFNKIPQYICCIALWMFLICKVLETTAILKFSNVKCKTLNANLTIFDYCHLKAVKRDVKEISIKWRNIDSPIDNLTLHIQFMKKSNGFTPFTPAIKLDACEYLRKRNNYVINSLYKTWSKYSNMNHTCPFDHDLIIDKLKYDDAALKWIPFPVGDYAFFTTFWIKGLRRFQIDFYFSYIDT